MATIKNQRIGAGGKRLLLLALTLTVLLCALSLSAYADNSYSDELWRNGKYSSTLGDMAGRRLYVYGIVDSFAKMPEDGTDADVLLKADEAAGRLDAALYLFRLCGTEPQGGCPFSDVPEDYAQAVTWLYEAGITKGVGNGLYGTGNITEYQLLVMLSRLLHWDAEDYDTVYAKADELGLLPLGQNGETFTNGALYQILSALLDNCLPESRVPAREEMSVPNQISVTAKSYDDALLQIGAALQYLPNTLQVQFTEDCPQEDIELFKLRFDWTCGDKAMPFIGAMDQSTYVPYYMVSYSSELRFKLGFSHYADAYAARADALDWLRVYADEAYSEALRSFSEQYILPLRDLPSDYLRVVRAHDLLCELAAYDNEYSSNNHPHAHSLLGFMENRTVVCDGYAKTYQWMLLTLGIDSYEVIGDAGGCHAWNKVRLDDAWYNVDVCWDDGKNYHTYLLQSDAAFEYRKHSFTDSYSATAFASPNSYA